MSDDDDADDGDEDDDDDDDDDDDHDFPQVGVWSSLRMSTQTLSRSSEARSGPMRL